MTTVLFVLSACYSFSRCGGRMKIGEKQGTRDVEVFKGGKGERET
jgi:hypothetical protein